MNKKPLVTVELKDDFDGTFVKWSFRANAENYIELLIGDNDKVMDTMYDIGKFDCPISLGIKVKYLIGCWKVESRNLFCTTAGYKVSGTQSYVSTVSANTNVSNSTHANPWTWTPLTQSLKPERIAGDTVPLGYLTKGSTEYYPYQSWITKGYVTKSS